MEILQKNAMLVSLNINCAGFSRKDKSVTDQVNNEHGASYDAGKYNKNLFSTKDTEVPKQLARQARSVVDHFCLHWSGNQRLLPVANYEKFLERITAIKSKFYQAVDDLDQKLPSLIEQRRAQLNGMFKESDYECYKDLKSLYKFNVNFSPIPSGDHFLVDLVEEETAIIKQEIEESNAQLLGTATQESFERLHKAVKHIATCLKDFEAVEVYKAGGKKKVETTRRLYDTMTTNLSDLVEILPALNITGDARLAGLIDDVRASSLLKHSVEDFRDPKQKHVVVTVQTEAQEIAEKMSGFFGGV